MVGGGRVRGTGGRRALDGDHGVADLDVSGRSGGPRPEGCAPARATRARGARGGHRPAGDTRSPTPAPAPPVAAVPAASGGRRWRSAGGGARRRETGRSEKVARAEVRQGTDRAERFHKKGLGPHKNLVRIPSKLAHFAPLASSECDTGHVMVRPNWSLPGGMREQSSAAPRRPYEEDPWARSG